MTMVTGEVQKELPHIPNWVCDIIQKVSEQKGLNLEQTSRLFIMQGASYYLAREHLEELKEEQG